MRKEIREASRELSGLGGVTPGGTGRGLSTGDFRRMRGDIQGLGRRIDKIGAGRPDPFLGDLLKAGPRRA